MTSSTLVDQRALLARFEEILLDAAHEESQREGDRALPHSWVDALREAGWGRLRVPLELGGLGASTETSFRLLVRAARADVNLAHVFRTHSSAVEGLRRDADPTRRELWLGRVADGALIAGGWSEASGTAGEGTSLARLDGRWVLHGRKFYATGSAYADWLQVIARRDGSPVTVLVPTDAPGVTVLDDWDGFGQRLTSSGSVLLDRVRIEAEAVRSLDETLGQFHPAHWQLVLLGLLAGIARATVSDAATAMHARGRVPANSTVTKAADDVQLQHVLGRLSSWAFLAEASVLKAARALDEVHALHAARGTPDVEAEKQVELDVLQAQTVIVDHVLRSTTHLFDVLGASGTARSLGLDRHWRNARTISSHNPVVYRPREIGDHFLNGTLPRPVGERWS